MAGEIRSVQTNTSSGTAEAVLPIERSDQKASNQKSAQWSQNPVVQRPTTVSVNLSGTTAVPVAPRQVTVALTGAVVKASQTNAHFEAMAASLRSAGLIQNHEELDTFSTFPFLRPGEALVSRVLRQFDANGDGVVDAKDGPIVFTAVGYSWGGHNAARLMTELLDRLAPGHQVKTRLILIEPYQPDGRDRLRIDSRIDEVHNFIQSQPPEDDCSRNPIVGTFAGKPLECAPGQDCNEYDYGHPEVPRQWTAPMEKVDHCTVPKIAANAIISLVYNGRIPMGFPTPPQEPVVRYPIRVTQQRLIKP